MKIDWKSFSKNPHYISLKRGAIYDIKVGNRSKKVVWGAFFRIFSVLQNHSYYTGKSVEELLELYETDRTFWWFSYYSEHHFKKMFIPKSNVKKEKITTYLKRINSFRTKQRIKEILQNSRHRESKKKRHRSRFK